MDEPSVLALPPEVTTDRIAALEADAGAALGPQGTRLVVDLDKTTFLGSAGLGMLVKLGKQLADRGGGIALARPTPTVQRLLRSVGLTSFLPHFRGLEEASAHLRRSLDA